MQKLGQHFLRNRAAVVKIVEALDVGDSDTIMEIGPGHGELTIPLAEECVRKNAKLIAIEKDEKLADELRAKSREAGMKNLEIISGDVLEILPLLIAKYQNAKTPNYKIVGNLPYYITGHLLRIVGELEPRPERCVFMVQKEVAERVAMKPPGMNRLAASVQFWSDPKIIARIPRKDFFPPPNVDSAIVVLKTKTENLFIPAEQYYAAMRALFAQPRKTVLNNLTSYEVGAMSYEGEKSGKKIEKKDIEARIREIGIGLKMRPQNLSIGDITAVAKSFF